MRRLLTLAILYSAIHAEAQLKFYEDSFRGGITTGGYSPAYSTGGTGNFIIDIAPGSTIRKAFLLAGRHGTAAALTVTLNGTPLTFKASNQITTFNSNYGGASGVHAIDVTSSINPSVNNYTLAVPTQGGPSNRFNDFYLFVAYELPSLQQISTAIFLNTFDFGLTVNYVLNFANPIRTVGDVGLSLFTGYACNTVTDGNLVSINNVDIGLIGNNDYNSGECGGPIGNCTYRNNILTGLGDDNADQPMVNADALSDLQVLLVDSATSFSIRFVHQPSPSPTDNAIWGAVVISGSPCPGVEANRDTTLCAGDTTQLSASGGISYSWKPTTGLDNPSIANPKAFPDTTTSYVVTATDGVCVGTDTVIVTILPPTKASIDVMICKGDTAQISATGGTRYSWSPTEGLNDPSIANPKASPNQTTTYVVTTINGSCVGQDSVVVTVLSTTMSVTPAALDLGTVSVDSTIEGRTSVVNENSFEVRVRDRWFVPPDFPATFTTATPMRIGGNSSQNISFSATPKVDSVYNAMLHVAIDSPCTVEVTIPVSITGASLEMCARTVDVGGKTPGGSATIPIVIEGSSKFRAAVSIDVTFTYDAELLRIAGDPSSAIGAVKEYVHDEKLGVLSFRVEPARLLDTPNAAIASLPVEALLASKATGEVEVIIARLEQNGRIFNARRCPSIFTLGRDCIDTADVRRRSNVAIEALYPNPSSGVIHCVVQSTDEREIQFDILNILGHIVRTKNYSVERGSALLEVSGEKLPVGLYFCRLQSRGVVDFRPFTVIE